MKINNRQFAFYFFVVGLLFWTTAADAFGQTKTNTYSPCVEVYAVNAKSTNQKWANLDYEPCKQAIVFLRTASVLVLDQDLSSSAGGYSLDSTLQGYLIEIGQNAKWKAKFNEVFSLNDAVNWFKETKLSPQSTSDLTSFLNRIFNRIYGRNASQTEINLYVPRIKAQQEAFTTIVAKEKGKLTGAEREAMIQRSYQAAFGRAANADDIKYWQPRSEEYVQIIESNRNYLHAPQNAAILREVVMRRFGKLPKSSMPSPSQIDAKIKQYSAQRRIFNEMN